MRIVLIADTHLAAEAQAFGRNLDAATARIAQLQPALVIHLGDVTADGVKDPAQFAYAKARLAALAAPLLVVPGNHDVGDCPPGGGVKEPALDLARLAAFRAAFGPDRWSLRVEGWLLVGVNSQLFDSHAEEEAEQAAWLAEVLREGEEPVALFLHKPLFRDDPADNPAHGRYAPVGPRTRLLERLARRDVRLVASGHVHQSRRIEDVRTLRLWAPSTAVVFPDAIQERIGRKACGITVLDLGADGVRVAFETPEDMRDHDLLDHPEVYPQVAVLRARL